MPWHKRGDDMSPRTGRPVKGNSKRDKSLQLRMSKEELEILDFCAEKLEISRTDVVNKGILLVKKELDKKE
nr:MAG TPA: NikA, BACTERIAL CONJUGATION, RELAXASE, DNA [Caudoviricetes sp.]